MTDTLTAPSESHSVPEKHIPIVKRRAKGIGWTPAVVFDGQAEAFNWIVTTLYQKLEAVLPKDGQAGVAAEFRARAGTEVKLRAVFPYRPGNYAFSEFLILKTPNGVSISRGTGIHVSWSRMLASMVAGLSFWIKFWFVMLLGFYWVRVLGRESGSWMGAIPVTCVAVLIFVPLVRALNRLQIDDDPSLFSSAQETMGTVYHQFVQDLKTPVAATRSES